MTVTQITKEMQAALGATHRVNLKYTDLTDTAGTAKTLTPFSALAAGHYIRFVCYRLKTNFDGGSTSDMTLSSGIVGLTTVATRLFQAQSVHEDGTEVPTFPPNNGVVDTSAIDTTYGQAELDVITSLRNLVNKLLNVQGMTVDQATDITLTATATGANLTALTQGEIDLFYQIVPLAKVCTT